MQHTNIDELKQLRNPERPDSQTGIAAPRRPSSGLFQGWGPKLMAVALAIGALAAREPAMAAKVVAFSSCTNHGATLLDSPTPDAVYGATSSGTAIMRVDLSDRGAVSAISIVQSAGDMLLDQEAIRVARASHYSPAQVNCTAAGDSVLYAVVFDQ